MSLEEKLEQFLINNIPITSAMGIKVDLATLQKVILKAPCSPNVNHKKTVFGGSLHSLTTLACWSLLYLNLNEIYQEDVQTVIAESEIKYLTPVIGDFKAECERPNTSDWEKFIKIFERKGKARLYLNATIVQSDHPSVNFTGSFVAVKNFNI